jgi:hypothetical protein
VVGRPASASGPRNLPSSCGVVIRSITRPEVETSVRPSVRPLPATAHNCASFSALKQLTCGSLWSANWENPHANSRQLANPQRPPLANSSPPPCLGTPTRTNQAQTAAYRAGHLQAASPVQTVVFECCAVSTPLELAWPGTSDAGASLGPPLRVMLHPGAPRRLREQLRVLTAQALAVAWFGALRVCTSWKRS